MLNSLIIGSAKMETKKSRVFKMPSVVITGRNSSQEVGRVIKKINCKKGLIVTDRNLANTKILASVKASFVSAEISCEIFDQIVTEPITDYVEQGLNIYKKTKCECIVAVGGGSSIDTAKAISVLTSNSGLIQDYEGLNKISTSGAPLIAIPTTAGTGSEVTTTTIITDTKRNVKMLLISPFLLPYAALVDPLLTVSMPRKLTAATGIDALTHAIEAYTSVKAQPLSDIFALSAIKLLAGNLRQAWANADDLKARDSTMMGAFQAGVAFSNSSVALVHGMSRPLGAYFHIPHGLSNAVLLAPVIEFSIPGNPQKYGQIAKTMGEKIKDLTVDEAAARVSKAVSKLVEDVEIPTLSELGIKKGKLEEVVAQMAEDSIASGSPGNNPRKATKKEIIELYWKAF